MKTLILSLLVILTASVSLNAQMNDALAMADTKIKEEKATAPASYEVAYPGGNSSLVNYLKENLKYTDRALENSYEGILKIKFTINTDGSVSDVKVINELESSLEQHVIKVIENMPKWRPAVREGKTISRKVVIPISFSLI